MLFLSFFAYGTTKSAGGVFVLSPYRPRVATSGNEKHENTWKRVFFRRIFASSIRHLSFSRQKSKKVKK